MSKNFIKILGCGSSQGVPKLDGNWGACKKKVRILELDVRYLQKLTKNSLL